ncbi:hypothetical protein S245_061366, partial [Arachis hypogaea]
LSVEGVACDCAGGCGGVAAREQLPKVAAEHPIPAPPPDLEPAPAANRTAAPLPPSRASTLPGSNRFAPLPLHVLPPQDLEPPSAPTRTPITRVGCVTCVSLRAGSCFRGPPVEAVSTDCCRQPT